MLLERLTTTDVRSSLCSVNDLEGGGNITWDSSTTGVNDPGMGVNFTLFANPNQSGINTSATVGKYEDTGAQYAHMIFNNGNALDLTTNNIVRVKVLFQLLTLPFAPAQLALKLQDGASGAPWETQLKSSSLI